LPAASWSDEQVLALYRARWQVELLIKRMKQVLRLAQLRGKTALTNEATILALLVCWALQQQARTVLAQASQQLAAWWQSRPHPRRTQRLLSKRPSRGSGR
jgi:IS4 transposase